MWVGRPHADLFEHIQLFFSRKWTTDAEDFRSGKEVATGNDYCSSTIFFDRVVRLPFVI